jgi:hypothetical protein
MNPKSSTATAVAAGVPARTRVWRSMVSARIAVANADHPQLVAALFTGAAGISSS